MAAAAGRLPNGAAFSKNPSDTLLCVSRTFAWRLLAIVAVLLAFIYAGHVLLVCFAGILLAIILRAAALFTGRLVGERWAYRAVLCAIVLVGCAVGYIVGPRVLTQTHEIARTVPQSLAELAAQLRQFQWGRDVTQMARRSMQSQELTAKASNYASTLLGGVTDGIAILAIGLFLGTSPGLYRRGLLRLLPAQYFDKMDSLLVDLGATVRNWLLGQLIPMSVLGVGTLIGLWLLHVPLAFTLALFTAAMLFVPYVGSVIAYVPTALIALTQGPMQVVWVTCVYLGVHIAEGYLITPLSQRHAIRLPPALTLFSQLLLWKAAGLLGVLVATPLAAAVMVAIQRLYLHEAPHSE